MSELFTNFDVILNVNKKRCERFDVADAIVAKMTNEIDEFLDRFENVTNLNIENFVVVLNEIDEIVDKIVVEILFLFLLKFRFETLIIFLV